MFLQMKDEVPQWITGTCVTQEVAPHHQSSDMEAQADQETPVIQELTEAHLRDSTRVLNIHHSNNGDHLK